jgi:hypothetical protein
VVVFSGEATPSWASYRDELKPHLDEWIRSGDFSSISGIEMEG